MTLQILGQIVFIVVLLVFSYIYSGSEVAIFSLQEIEKLKLGESRSRKDRLLYRFTQTAEISLITILFGNMVVNLGASILGERLSDYFFRQNSVIFSIFIMTFLVLLFGEITPKSLAAANPIGFGKKYISIINITYKIFYPIILALKSFLKEEKPDTHGVSFTKDEILAAVEVGEEVGLDHDSVHILKNLVELLEKPVTDIMVPRSEIEACDINAPLHEIRDFVRKSTHTNILFYRENIDNIIGYCPVSDFLGLKQKKEIYSKIIEPLYVPESKNTISLLSEMKELNIILSVVLDEYGGTSGVVTIKDILDAIFIREIVITRYIKKLADNRWIIDGRLPISDFNSYFKTELPEESGTIGGFIINKIGSIPPSGTEIKINNSYIIMVRLSDSKQVESVEIRRIDI